MRKTGFILFVFALITLSLSSCKDDPLNTQEQFDKDQKTILKYLEENGIVAEQDPDYGLYYVMHNPGSGDKAQQADRIVVRYEGRDLGTTEVFDSNDSIQFTLGNLIVGWRVLIPLMEEGGSMTMYLPRGVAYNEKNLEFDVELIDVR